MIELDVQTEIAIVALNRPEKRNALTPGMLDELNETLDQLDDQFRALILIGKGKTFCAGFDLKQCAQHPDGSMMRALLTGLSGCITSLRRKPFPVVVGVHGAAVAGGCALLGGADIVVAQRHTKLGYPVVKIGVSPAVSAAHMLAAINPGTVRSRLLDTQLIDADRAMKLGLVHHLVEDPSDVRDRCQEIATSLASKPPAGVHATKEWLNEITHLITDHARSGLETSLALTGSDEERERLAALWGK